MLRTTSGERTTNLHSYCLPSSFDSNCEVVYVSEKTSEVVVTVVGEILFLFLKVRRPLLHTMSTLLVIPLTVVALHVSVSA